MSERGNGVTAMRAKTPYTPAMEGAISRKRRRWVWLLPLAVIGLCAAAVLAFTHWGAAWLMPTVANRIEAASSLRFTAAGPVEAKVAPWLGLRVADVDLTPAGPGAQPLIHADAAELELSWPALLHGQIAIARVRLVRSRLPAMAALPPGAGQARPQFHGRSRPGPTRRSAARQPEG